MERTEKIKKKKKKEKTFSNSESDEPPQKRLKRDLANSPEDLRIDTETQINLIDRMKLEVLNQQQMLLSNM